MGGIVAVGMLGDADESTVGRIGDQGSTFYTSFLPVPVYTSALVTGVGIINLRAQFIDEIAEFSPAVHHRLLIDKLQEVADGLCRRLMIFMPPGSAKSTYANIYFAPWWLGRNPTGNIITASYGQELADKWGIDIFENEGDNANE